MDWPIGTAILFALLFSGIPIGYCLTHPQWRLSVQTHKYIGVR